MFQYMNNKINLRRKRPCVKIFRICALDYDFSHIATVKDDFPEIEFTLNTHRYSRPEEPLFLINGIFEYLEYEIYDKYS